LQLILSVCENTILASPRATRVRLPNWREAVLGLHDCQMTIAELIAAARGGSPRAAGRLLSLVEGERRDEVLASLDPSSVLVIGITGPPGAGKSTTIAALVGAYRQRELRVAVLAVDPSSPFSGGALLGDRIRMAAHINDPDVGQSEIEIAAVADPTVVILNPGAGDAVQAAKAGLLEVADIVAVNKADREGAEQTVRDLRAETKAPIISLVAAKCEGLSGLMEAIDAHHRADSRDRRSARARAQILSLAQTRLRTHPDLERLAESVADGRDDPYNAAAQLLAPAPQPHCAAEEKTHDNAIHD
jgi:LAO/AO transport system kinase